MTMCHVIDLNRLPEVITALRSIGPIKAFAQDFALTYSGQIPNISLLLVQGKIEFFDKEECERIVSPTCLIAAPDLWRLEPSKFDIIIQGGSRAALLDRPTLANCLDHHQVALAQFMEGLLTS